MKYLRFLVLFLFSIALSSDILAQESKIDKAQVPSAVIEIFVKTYPKAIVKNYVKDVIGKETFYEVESIDGSTHRDIIYSPLGVVIEIEEGVSLGDLPQEVTKAIAEKYPKGVLRSAEKVTKAGTIMYDVVVAVGKKKFTLEAKVDSKGVTLQKE